MPLAGDLRNQPQSSGIHPDQQPYSATLVDLPSYPLQKVTLVLQVPSCIGVVVDWWLAAVVIGSVPLESARSLHPPDDAPPASSCQPNNLSHNLVIAQCRCDASL